jgi:hypothetical protein
LDDFNEAPGLLSMNLQAHIFPMPSPDGHPAEVSRFSLDPVSRIWFAMTPPLPGWQQKFQS